MKRLMDLADECFDERFPRTVAVTGEPGVGKSRVRHELLSRFADLETQPIIWFARGDEMRRGVPLHVMRQMLGRAFLAEVEDVEAQRSALRDSLVELLPLDRVPEVEPYLAEAIEIADDADAELLAARENPEVLQHRIRQAFTELVEAVTRRAPLVLVVEDVQNGDLASFRVFEGVVRRDDTPLLVLVFGRPRARELLPLLATDWDLTIMRLRGLRSGDAEALAREVLGDRATDAAVERIVGLADGNPLQLEELLRAMLEQNLTEGMLPASLATVLSSRLERLDPKLRAVVRAACIFGETFMTDGVASLLGAGFSRESLESALGALVRAEIIRPLGTNRESEAHGYRFRQGLFRDAAYASLSAEDRAAGHGLAADFEVARGAPEPDVLAHHLLNADRRSEAAKQLLRAASEAWAANDPVAVLSRVARALDVGADEWSHGPLLALAGRAHVKLGQLDEADERFSAALEVLPERSSEWWAVLGDRVAARTMRRAPEALSDAEALVQAPTEVLRSPALAAALGATTFNLINNGPKELAESLFDRMESAFGESPEPWAVAALGTVRARLAYTRGDLEDHINNCAAAYSAFERLGEHGKAAWQLVAMAFGLTEVGFYDRAISLLSRARRIAEEVSDAQTLRHAELQLAHVSGLIGEVGPALPVIEKVLFEAKENGDYFTQRVAQGYLAFCLWRSGRREDALAAARANVVGVEPEALAALFSSAIMGSVLVELGRNAEAIEVLSRVLANPVGDAGRGEGLARLGLFRALSASGSEQAALEALAAGRDRLLARAAKITNEEMRRSYLERIDPHAILLLEAKKRLGGPSEPSMTSEVGDR
jgi:tetratricopeptide (TPR) repeat protein